MFTDSHCHLTFSELAGDMAGVRAAMAAAQVTRALCISTTMEEFASVQALATEYDNFWASAGVHPDSEDVHEPSVAELVAATQMPKVVAIGETGLDYYQMEERKGGRGIAKASAPGAILIQFVGGIHEIYFPYVLMKPKLIIATILGGMTGVFINVLFGSGLRAPAAPGSVLDRYTQVPEETPAVVAETPEWVAMASEYRALAGLPGVERARIFEPEPEEVYAWQR